MKIYASSFGFCSEPSRFRRLFGTARDVAVITNALDFSTEHERRQRRLDAELDQLAALGLRPAEVDLRTFFGFANALHETLATFAGVWVIGGNVFVLRRAMSYSGFDRFIWDKRHTDPAFVYGGYSAGSCVLAPSLRGLELVDPPEQTAPGYERDIIWEGLGVIDCSIAPHFESDHPESRLIDDVVSYFKREGVRYQALRDGEAIVVDTDANKIEST